MSNNQPAFDPLKATDAEETHMVRGYMDQGNRDKPPITSVAYDHGWRMSANDRAGVVDDDQRELARRFARQ